MRQPRWKAPPEMPSGHYHCISRVVDRQFVFQERERERFRQLLDEYAAFCGVRVLTWCILSNHFHLLIEIPRKPEHPPPLDELIARLDFLAFLHGDGNDKTRHRAFHHLTAVAGLFDRHQLRGGGEEEGLTVAGEERSSKFLAAASSRWRSTWAGLTVT